MKVLRTDFEGLCVLEPRVFNDERGCFFEAFNKAVFEQYGLKYDFVQDNQSHSVYGVVRGLHYQLGLHAQTKLVRVLQGEILDVAVDMRKESKTFGKYFSVHLSADNRKQLLIPQGFAHGFSVLSESADVLYKCDALYHKESEGGVLYSDTTLLIDWKIPADKIIVSEKDAALPLFNDAINHL